MVALPPIRPVTVHRYHASSVRRRFTFAEDSYERWVMMAPAAGAFVFTLTLPTGPGHIHPPTGELRGRCDFGQVVLCPPGGTLERRMVTPTAFHFGEFSSEVAIPPGKAAFRDVSRLGSTLGYLAEEYNAALGQITPAMAHLVADLLYLLLRERFDTHKDEDPLIQRAAAYIESHCSSPGLTLQALATRLGLSAAQLTRRFGAVYGTSPAEYRTTVRLTKARRLLLESDETIGRIAIQCGYNSQFYFSRVFTSRMGQNPTQYRKQHRI